jgi:hypothetical protein
VYIPRQRALAFRHAYALPRPIYTSSNPAEHSDAGSGGVRGGGGGDGTASVSSADSGDGDGAQDAGRGDARASSRCSSSEPHVVAVLYRHFLCIFSFFWLRASDIAVVASR